MKAARLVAVAALLASGLLASDVETLNVIPSNPLSAVTLEEVQKAAAAGNASAQDLLGVAYRNGDGVPQDYAKALKWFEKAADQGFAKAQFNLGEMYCRGQGVQEDCSQGAKWLHTAAAQGHVTAQYNLGGMYYDGQGLPQDYAEALK